MTNLKTKFAARSAKKLRANSTIAENRLWYVLRSRHTGGHKFVRQMPVGPYIADFSCRAASLIVEIDGGQRSGSTFDARRAVYLTNEGYAVLRFWNNEVLENRDGVLQAIVDVLAGHPSPDLRFAPATVSPGGRGIRGAHAAASSRLANQKKARNRGTLSSPLRGEGGPKGRMRGDPTAQTHQFGRPS